MFYLHCELWLLALKSGVFFTHKRLLKLISILLYLLSYYFHLLGISLLIPLFLAFLNNFILDIAYSRVFLGVSHGKSFLFLGELSLFTFIDKADMFGLNSVIFWFMISMGITFYVLFLYCFISPLI